MLWRQFEGREERSHYNKGVSDKMKDSHRNDNKGHIADNASKKEVEPTGKPNAFDIQFGNGSYRIENRRFVYNKVTRRGDVPVTLSAFIAWIVRDIFLDNGVDEQRHFEIQGVLADGTLLPVIRLSATSFVQMVWMAGKWGPRAIVAAGNSAKDRLREAIQTYSVLKGIEERRVFTHTGWRKVGGKMVFLIADCKEADVALPTGLDMYRLPRVCADQIAACRASRDFLCIAPLSITVPILSALYLAPLCELLQPAFTLWILGQTGAFKTTLATLGLCHFGFFDTRNIPASWESTTNMLERLAFCAKDIPLLIDDFYPQPTRGAQKAQEEKVARIVRAQGNLSGRGRMKGDTTLRQPYPPRGIIIATGEMLPSIGVSGIARLFKVEINPGDVDIKTLGDCQKQAHLYPGAMRAYVDYLAPQLPSLKETLQREFHVLRASAAGSNEHLKIPEEIAWLTIGFEQAISFWRSVGALDEPEASELLIKGWETLKALAPSQDTTIQEADPCIRFFDTIATLLAQHRVHFARRKNGNAPENGEAWGWVPFETQNGDREFKLPIQSQLLGWIEGAVIYLIPDAAHKVVVNFCRNQSEPFVISKNEILRRLEAKKILIPFAGGEHTRPLRCAGLNHRVAQIKVDMLEKS